MQPSKRIPCFGTNFDYDTRASYVLRCCAYRLIGRDNHAAFMFAGKNVTTTNGMLVCL